MTKTKVSLFGSGGMLGTDLGRLVPDHIQLFPYMRDVDITNIDKIRTVLNQDKPAWVINAVAYSQVDKAETEKEKAFAVNAQGPKNLVEVCKELDIPLIQVSTDYVFSGDKQELYKEDDGVRPVCVYGASKLMGELNVQKYAKHYILRTSSLYGTARANHASRAIEAIKEGKETTVVDDLICSPTFTGDLAKWVYELIEKKPQFGIYHLCHTGSCSRYDFAQTLCRLLKAKEPFPLKTAKIGDLELPATRPLQAVLSMEKWEKNVGPLLSWEEGLKNYLSQVKH